MKDDKSALPAQSEQDILRVLQAERDAELTIRDCELETQQIIDDAQTRVQRIETRANQRISNMEMRHSHKLNNTISKIEREGANVLSNSASLQFDEERLKLVIDRLAIELSIANTASDDDSEAGK